MSALSGEDRAFLRDRAEQIEKKAVSRRCLFGVPGKVVRAFVWAAWQGLPDAEVKAAMGRAWHGDFWPNAMGPGAAQTVEDQLAAMRATGVLVPAEGQRRAAA